MNSASGARIKCQTLEQKVLLVFYHLWNYKDFKSSVPRTRAENKYIFVIMSKWPKAYNGVLYGVVSFQNYFIIGYSFCLLSLSVSHCLSVSYHLLWGNKLPYFKQPHGETQVVGNWSLQLTVSEKLTNGHANELQSRFPSPHEIVWWLCSQTAWLKTCKRPWPRFT